MMDCKNAMRNIMFVWHFMFHVRYILLDIKLEKVYDLLNMALWYDTARPEEHVRRQYKLYGGHIMTQIKNINAMQELTEVQEDMADTHDKFHNKSLKGKKGYITFARTKEGITFSTYTDDENDQIIGSVFIQGGSMKSPVITDSFKDIKPDAEYKIMVHVWNNDFGYLWTNINRPNGLTRIDYLIMSGGWGQENPVQNLVEQCYFKKGSVEETSHEQI